MPRFGLIGEKLDHSFSPAIHRLIGDYEYALYPMARGAVEGFVRDTDLDGFNVTIPYKVDVIPLCRRLTPRAEAIGSVNTMVRFEDGGFLGDNTDYGGFSHLLGEEAAAFAGQKAVVLGSGGSSRTVCAVLVDQGIRPVVISRTGVDHYGNLDRHKDAVLLVNTTPVGMYPGNGAAPVDLAAFPNVRLVLDLIYNPDRTALLLQADDLGIPARNGLSMLTAQGVRAAELFLGRPFPAELADTIAQTISRKTRNIVLIGMPGSGKSTVAQHLSHLTGRPAVSLDRRVEARAGKSIPEIFAGEGEKAFRRLETEVLREASRESGQILDTGGGVVTVPENRDLIRQNGVCILLERNLELLPTQGRPLSQQVGVEELLRVRGPLYRAWCERAYRNEDSYATAMRIREDFGL